MRLEFEIWNEEFGMKTEKTPQDIKERSFSFAVEIVKLCRSLDPKCVSSRNISYQLTKAGTHCHPEKHQGQHKQFCSFLIRCFSFQIPNS